MPATPVIYTKSGRLEVGGGKCRGLGAHTGRQGMPHDLMKKHARGG
jgi:hypothetical protein